MKKYQRNSFVGHKLMLFRLEIYFDSIHKIGRLPDDPPNWQHHIHSNAESSVSLESGGGISGGKDHVSESIHYPLAIGGETSNTTSATVDDSGANSRKKSKLIKAFTSDLIPDTERKLIAQDSVDSWLRGSSISRVEEEPASIMEEELPSILSSSKGKHSDKRRFHMKRGAEDSTEQKGQTECKRSKKILNSDDMVPESETEIRAKITPSQKSVALTKKKRVSFALKKNAKKYEEQQSTGVMRVNPILTAPFSLRSALEEKLKDRLGENAMDYDNHTSLPSRTIKLITQRYSAHLEKVQVKLQRFRDIEHLITQEQAETADASCLKFWKASECDMSFKPPIECPDSLSPTKSERLSYSKLVEGIEKKRTQVKQLIDNIQKGCRLHGLTVQAEKSIKNALPDIDSFQKSLALENIEIMKGDIASILERGQSE